MTQGTTDRQVNLASLVPENAIDPEMRISSLDGWTKIEQIGDGTYGAVYKYTTNMKETPIAAGKHLKVQLFNLNEKQKADLKSRVMKFILELNTLNKISSECSERFVQFIGCYLDSKKLVLFTEWMPNGSIKEHIVDKPLDEATALKYIFQATQGLHFIHHYQKGTQKDRFVHRDIKCDNLLLTSNNDVKLADFGLACNLAVDNESYTMPQSAPCGFAGTTIFAAPEVLVGGPYGRRADIWSLGCTLVEMLTSQPPHSDFWHKHKERAHFLFIEQAQGDPARQLKYTARHLVPEASLPVRKLLDCLFTRNEAHRPKSEDVLGVFVYDASTSSYNINVEKLEELKSRIHEEEKKAV